jgi:ATP-dependent helicase/nuclease subunit A
VNRVVIASAGTGKTHTLVGIVCQALLGAHGKAIAPEKIVATTFSRKARFEIVDRLTRELTRLRDDPGNSPYVAEMAVEPALLQARAASLLSGPVRRVRVDTFHGLAFQMLRDNTAWFGPAPTQILDEGDTWTLRRDAVDLALENFSQRGFEQCLALARSARNVDSLRTSVLYTLGELDELATPVLAARDDSAQIEEWVHEFHRLVCALPRAEANPLGAALLSHWRMHDEQAWCTTARGVEDLTLGRKADEEVALAEFLATFEGGTKPARLANFIELVAKRALFGETARHVVALVSESARLVEARLRELDVVTFGDVQRRLRDGLCQNPEAARALGAQIDLLVVDEFQDTSPVQAEIVRLLRAIPGALNAGAVPELAQLKPQGLVIVGDRKQSIYGFRGADARLFAQFCVGLAGADARTALGLGEAHVVHAPTATLSALQISRRSSAPVVNAINAFSREHFRGTQSTFDVAYTAESEDLHTHSRTESAGIVLWHKTPTRAKDASSRRDEAVAIRDTVMHVHEGKTSLGPQAFRTMAVLAQSHATLEAVAFELSQARIPHVTGDMRVYSAREVRDLRALLAYALAPKATLPLLEILRGPCVGLSDDALIALAPAIRAGEPLPALPALERWNQASALLLPLAHKLAPYALLQLFIEALDLRTVWLQLPRGDERMRAVEHALAALQSSETLEAAIRFLDQSKEAQKRAAEPFAEDQEGVRLLTVHASKGLSFPIVILPDVARRPRNEVRSFAMVQAHASVATLGVRIRDARGEWLSPPDAVREIEERKLRTEAERKRVWYVALTRAERGIVFVGDTNKTAGIVSTLRVLESNGMVAEITPEVAPLGVADVLPAPCATSAPVSVTVRRLRLSPTALSDFHHCARRFQLVHLLDIAEEKPTFSAARSDVDARLEGTLAHQILERLPAAQFGTTQLQVESFSELRGLEPEAQTRVLTLVQRFVSSRYAAHIANAALLREAPFRMSLRSAKGTELVLSGVIDLVVRHADGTVDVIDYKRARGPDPTAHAFQLAVYARAARAMFVGAQVRAGVVFLGAKGEPDFLAEDVLTEQTLEVLADRFVEARTQHTFQRAPRGTCSAIRCGYVPRCYGQSDDEKLPPP